MADVRRAGASKVQEIRAEIEKLDERVIKELRHGNIHEVLAKFKVNAADYEQYFQNQWKVFKGQVVQEDDVKAMMASNRPPNVDEFPVHSKSNVLSPDEQQMFADGLMKGMSLGSKFKGMKMQQADEAEQVVSEEAEAASAEELEGVARGTLSEWDQFLSDSWIQIMDAQMMADYQSRMSEIKKEVDRLIALAKSGAVGVEFVLIALLKVKSTKAGVLTSWMGKKMYKYNENMGQIAQDLSTISTDDPNYVGQAQLASSEMKDASFQMNLLQQDMQKVFQDVSSSYDQVHGIMGELNRLRRDITARISARG